MTGIAQLFLDIKNKLLAIADFVYQAMFIGTGLNDAIFAGVYTGATYDNLNETITVTIDLEDTVDTFSVTTKDGTVTGVAITGTPQYLGNGIRITFDAVTGHTIGDSWTYTITGTPVIQFCQVWNNQTQQEADGKMYDYPKPAVFVELINQADIQQLGNGDQIYNDMTVRLHIVHEFYNATDNNGIEEQDLTIFELTQRVYYAMNRFEPTAAAALVRYAEQQQFDHTNVYEFIQDYKTNLVDVILDAPLNYIIKDPVTNYEGNLSFMTPPYTKAL